MEALFAFITWIMSVVAPVAPATSDVTIGEPDAPQTQGVHIVNTNPRTVVALEDTHFRPNR